MRLSPREIDDIRVAALLHDMENLEITARVLSKAVGDLEATPAAEDGHTFHGTELVHSLGSVLTGAFPLILNLNDTAACEVPGLEPASGDPPFGARVIRTVREYDRLLHGDFGELGGMPADVINELRLDAEANHHPAVLHALERAVLGHNLSRGTRVVPLQPVESRELEAATAD
jgi:hypothetical protein